MAFFNDFKEKVTNAALSVTSKTKDSVEITKMATERRSISGEISELYEQIGRIYFESDGSETQKIESLCTRVRELRARYDELERLKMQLRNQNRCPSCGAVMSQNAKFCSNCGRRMPEPAPEPEATPDPEDVSYCRECGAMRKDDERYCSVCGADFTAEAEPEAPAEPETVEAEATETEPVQEAEQPEAAADADEEPSDFDA